MRSMKVPVGQYPEEEGVLFNKLQECENSTILHFLERAYAVMSPQQRRTIFGEMLDDLRLKAFPGDSLLAELKNFYEESINGRYYAPFEINSKNFSLVPPETEEWFDRIGDFFNSAVLLVQREQHAAAVEAFELIYELIDAMESGDEIVFADEYGSWMIPVKEGECVAAYLKAVACIENAVGFANAAVEMLKRDQRQSFSLNVYSSAINVGNSEQKMAFEAKVEKLGLPIKGNW